MTSEMCFICDETIDSKPADDAAYSPRTGRYHLSCDIAREMAKRAADASREAAKVAAATAAQRMVAAETSTLAALGYRRLSAQFPSTCPSCRERILLGAVIAYAKGSPAQHAACAGGSGPAAAATTKRCAACHTADTMLMNSSFRGAVCADCYDRIEIEA